MRQRKHTLSEWHNSNLQLTTYNLQLLFVVSCLLLIVSFYNAFAIPGINEPIIPCGTEIVTDPVTKTTTISNSCTFCHIFELIQNVYNFSVFVFIPPLAVFLIAIGGFYWLSAAGSEERVKKGQQILLTVLWGLAIVYISWLVISFAINVVADPIGATYDPAKWYKPHEWFNLKC